MAKLPSFYSISCTLLCANASSLNDFDVQPSAIAGRIYISEGNMTTMIGNEVTDDFEREELPIKSIQIDFDVYLHWKANKSNKLYFNIIPTVINGSNDRSYQTSEVELYNTISNCGYRLFGEGVWECRIGNGILTSRSE